MMIEEKELKFTVDSALLKELGEKLVETVQIALAELVKNAYDADATEVKVIIDTDREGKNYIKIEDNGLGMSFEAVNKYWMRIATTNKVSKVSKVFGRPQTGAKGIGRFSCRRLGSKLTLITNGTKQGNRLGKCKNIESTKVIFPWDDFKVGTDVTSIVCRGSQEVIKTGVTGTALIIEGIIDEWNNRSLNWLKRQLAVLVANTGAKREGFKEDLGFSLELIAPDFEEGVRDLREDLINAGWGTLTARINSKNQAVCELVAEGIGRRKITSSSVFKGLKDVKLRVGIMVDVKGKMRDVSVVSKQNLRKILPNWGGVQIKYRGFRVYPYGNDDWLDIDKDRGFRKGSPNNELQVFAESLRGVEPSRSLLNMSGMRSYIGGVEIGPDANGFEMKTNREGFLASEEMSELKKFVRFAIDWSTILRDYSIRLEEYALLEKIKKEFAGVLDEEVTTNTAVDKALGYIDTNIRKLADSLPPDERNEIEESLFKASELIKQYNTSIQIELSHLRLIASTSTLLLIFSHEVKSLMGLLEQSKNYLGLLITSLKPRQKKEVVEITENFDELNLRLEELLNMTTLISTSKFDSKPGRIALKSKVKKVQKIFELIIEKYGIEIDISDIPNNIVIVEMMEAELYSILLNVMSNSIKAVIAKGGKRKIKLSAEKSERGVVIKIQDSGIGISPSRFGEVFTPFISDPDGVLYQALKKRLNPEDNMIVGTGSGLGLGIVKEIVLAHNGVIAFKKPDKEWSSMLQIELRK